jgi:hypothetical protein
MQSEQDVHDAMAGNMKVYENEVSGRTTIINKALKITPLQTTLMRLRRKIAFCIVWYYGSA